MQVKRLFVSSAAALAMCVVPVHGGFGAVQRPRLEAGAILTCDGTDGFFFGNPAPGTVALSQSATKVSAVVKLRGAAPNTAYVLRLIQGREDCRTIDGTVRTDSAGNAVKWLVEKRAPLSATTLGLWFVTVETGRLFGTPSFTSHTYVQSP